MKIIVCGAGSVGRSIVGYLVKGNNDIVVIDSNQRDLDEVSQEYDVLPVAGEPSHPDVLEKAGADEADLLLAVTDVDEVNMAICQIAHSLFQVPRKIARIDSEAFLDPLWETLYSDVHLPIDQVISPDMEIAGNILNILKYPGTAGVLPVLDDKWAVVTLRLTPQSPLIKIQLMQLERVAPDLKAAVVNLSRDNRCFIPESYDEFLAGDEVNLLVPMEEIDDVVRSFGVEKPANERLLIFGGNDIAAYLGAKIEHDDSIISCRIVEESFDKAKRLARDLSHVVVIQGEMMSDVILEEADIRHADASIAVTENDKDNLLASLLAAKSGVQSTISVVNTPSYNNLIVSIGDNILVDRSSVTISKILKEIRKTKMQEAYSLSRGSGEIWEIKITEDSLCRDKKIGELGLPKQSRIFGLQRENEVVFPEHTTELCVGDVILLYVDSGVIKQAERIFG